MRKILIYFIMASSFIFANQIDLQGLMNKTSKSTDNTEKKQVYKDLISFLKNSPSGEYTMYLAIIYLNGISEPDADGEVIKENIPLAISNFEKSIGLGFYKSSAILGSLYLFDDRFKKIDDFDKKAKFYLSQGLENGVNESIMALSSYYFYYEKNSKKALELLHAGANKNISTAQLALATTYGYGSEELNISKDEFLGNKYLKEACENEKQSEYVKKFCKSTYILKGE